MLDSRSKLLLRALVERYIADGQPVGSRTLSKAAGLDLSPATIRNVMSDLEDLGLIASPHTSAGRVPTPKGYRLFVDTMLTVRRGSLAEGGGLISSPIAADQPQRVIANAAQHLSSLSQFVGVVMAPKRASVFKHIEFLSLSEHRVLVIIVAPDGDVQNRVIHLDKGPTQSQLIEAANYLNAHFSGQPLNAVRERLRAEVDDLRAEIADLMKLAVDASVQAMEAKDEVVISGERNLLSVSDFSGNLGNLRKLFDLFEQKTQLMGLLEVSDTAQGVRIYIGGEGHLVPVQDMAIVSAPYEVDGTVVGTLGVIGPQRMPYDKMIEIVDITSKLLGNALSQSK